MLELVEHERSKSVVDVEAGGDSHVGDEIESDLVGLGVKAMDELEFLIVGAARHDVGEDGTGGFKGGMQQQVQRAQGKGFRNRFQSSHIMLAAAGAAGRAARQGEEEF